MDLLFYAWTFYEWIMKLFLVMYELFLLFFMDTHVYDITFHILVTLTSRVTSFDLPFRSYYELRVWQHSIWSKWSHVLLVGKRISIFRHIQRLNSLLGFYWTQQCSYKAFKVHKDFELRFRVFRYFKFTTSCSLYWKEVLYRV